MRSRLFFVVGLIAPALLLTCAVRLPAQAKVPVAGPSWALVGGTVYVSPTEPPIRNAIILIRSGTIRKGSVQLPAEIQKLDCSGLTITAGFWNSHVHFVQRKE